MRPRRVLEGTAGSGPPPRWSGGDTIVLREVWRGLVWSERPATVVADDGRSVVVWLPAGTRWLAPTVPPTRERAPSRAERLSSCLALEDWVLVERQWDVSTLWFVEPGERYCAWVSWLPTGGHLGWYVNLQEPFERTSAGFDWMDLMLDILVEPDRTWRWKDEDEFAALIERGLIDAQTADEVRAAADVAIARLAEQAAPFDAEWPRWRPEPGWGVPVLPGRVAG